ncbi:hypothetical protein FHS61_000467 [Altererythrobacter atlanticus]|uniref:Uncharacterized protein n=1 Tax=Croceibacterium atlanticum TaxID=1267766 RepID=A0A0F7KTX4_9SPHN|nr:hypothetical protein [Croceibacterium atlanticum]AKH42697.1 hypothetical protein WYH_01661 [Croceibacterium atlanticum]MBB5731474.1 hypothetical protein [Croceibacterium atlanticum]
MADPLLWVASAAGIAGVGVLRMSWAGRKRSTTRNSAGWLLLLVGAIGGALAEGAWGVSIVSLFAMGTAALILAHSAITAPPGKAKPSDRRVRMLPEAGESLHIGARLLTFVLVAIVLLAISVGLGIAIRGFAYLAGMNEANSNVTGLFAVPIIWSILAVWLLMLERPRNRLILVLASCIPILPLLFIGASA